MIAPRFYEWDWDAGVVTQFARAGECKKCGECCKRSISLVASPPFYGNNGRNGGYSCKRTGIWQEIKQGRWRRFYKVDLVGLSKSLCAELGLGNLCKRHDEKDALCRLWPFSPRCLAQLSDCGYSFQTIDQWGIEVKSEPA